MIGLLGTLKKKKQVFPWIPTILTGLIIGGILLIINWSASQENQQEFVTEVRRDNVSGGQVNYFSGPTTFNNNPEIAKSLKEVVTPPGKNNKNSWHAVFSGKQITPEEGKLYTDQFPDGAKVNYLLKDDKMHIEYLNPEGDNAYYVVDRDGNVDARRLLHQIKEYSVVIPDGLEISRKTTALNNGYQQIRIELKWGESIDMIFDSNKHLQWLHITGGTRIDNAEKTITPKLPDKINEMRN